MDAELTKEALPQSFTTKRAGTFLRQGSAAEALSTYGILSRNSTMIQMEAARSVAMSLPRNADQAELPCSEDWRWNAKTALAAYPKVEPAEGVSGTPLTRQLRRQTGRIMGRVMVSKSKTHKRKEAKLDMKARRRLKHKRHFTH